jgi:hypothetical protein
VCTRLVWLLVDQNGLGLGREGEPTQMVEYSQWSPGPTPMPTPTPSNLCRQPFLDRCYTPNSAEEQATRQNNRHIDTRYNAESTSETKSQQSTLALPGLREPAQRTKPARPVRTSIKKDLTVAEISCVARSLLRGDAINFLYQQLSAHIWGLDFITDRHGSTG